MNRLLSPKFWRKSAAGSVHKVKLYKELQGSDRLGEMIKTGWSTRQNDKGKQLDA